MAKKLPYGLSWPICKVPKLEWLAKEFHLNKAVELSRLLLLGILLSSGRKQPTYYDKPMVHVALHATCSILSKHKNSFGHVTVSFDMLAEKLL
jgi:hypothetical protein